MKVAAPKADRKALFEAAHKEAENEPKAATTASRKRSEKPAEEAKPAEATETAAASDEA
jgi:small subunit ribosomal protein S16